MSEYHYLPPPDLVQYPTQSWEPLAPVTNLVRAMLLAQAVSTLWNLPDDPFDPKAWMTE